MEPEIVALLKHIDMGLVYLVGSQIVVIVFLFLIYSVIK